MVIQFKDIPPDAHHCVPVYSGDWIIWRCPICADYERRYNIRSGKMKVKGKTATPHLGGFSQMKAETAPPEFCEN